MPIRVPVIILNASGREATARLRRRVCIIKTQHAFTVFIVQRERVFDPMRHFGRRPRELSSLYLNPVVPLLNDHLAV